jgi:hypothetical protein
MIVLPVHLEMHAATSCCTVAANELALLGIYCNNPPSYRSATALSPCRFAASIPDFSPTSIAELGGRPYVGLQVIWAIGTSMVVLAGAIFGSAPVLPMGRGRKGAATRLLAQLCLKPRHQSYVTLARNSRPKIGRA